MFGFLKKVAVKKTAGVLGDDLALNAQQVTGVDAHRELPIVWAVAKGSAINKVILIPCALLISFFVPTLIVPLLMCGGAFLCFEGFEKIYEKILHLIKKNSKPAAVEYQSDKIISENSPAQTSLEFEREKIKGAVRTDFILSAEIIVITLGTVGEAIIQKQIMVLIGIGIAMTVGVYGLVAAIVKIDDLGFWFMNRSTLEKKIGNALLIFAPLLMKFLGVAGTAAMFLVGGGIITHGIHALHELKQSVDSTPAGIFIDLGVGITTGLIIFIAIAAIKFIKKSYFRNTTNSKS